MSLSRAVADVDSGDPEHLCLAGNRAVGRKQQLKHEFGGETSAGYMGRLVFARTPRQGVARARSHRARHRWRLTMSMIPTTLGRSAAMRAGSIVSGAVDGALLGRAGARTLGVGRTRRSHAARHRTDPCR